MPRSVVDRTHRGPEPSGGGAAERVELADRISEDLVQRLFAARQDLAELIDRDGADTGEISASLLSVIGGLREVSVALRGHEAGATRMPDPPLPAQGPGRLEDDGAARALVIQCRLARLRSREIVACSRAARTAEGLRRSALVAPAAG